MNYQVSYWLSKITVNYPANKPMLRYYLHKLIWGAYPGIPRDSPQPFLFTVTNTDDKNYLHCFVQSRTQPMWDHIDTERNKEKHDLSLTQISIKKVQVGIYNGIKFSFRLHTSPIKNEFLPGRARGKKTILSDTKDIEKWFLLKTKLSGFYPENFELKNTKVKTGIQSGTDIKYYLLGACQFEGILRVNDVDRFKDVLCKGIGPKKSFGFGMMMIGRA
jgi:CRISPR-associated protein Cas6/Cse3/CasE subtype I-E